MGSQDEYVAPAAPVARDVAVDELMVTRATHDAFASLVGVDLKTIFSNRACIMGSPPRFLRGAHRTAMRFALEEVESGVDAQNEQRICPGWKLFLLLPRMLSPQARPWRVGAEEEINGEIRRIHPRRVDRTLDHQPIAQKQRPRAESDVNAPSKEIRLSDAQERAEQLVQWGELSSARSALEGAPWHLGMTPPSEVCKTPANGLHCPVNRVFLVISPNPILHFAPFLSTHFFPCLNPIFKNGSFCPSSPLCL